MNQNNYLSALLDDLSILRGSYYKATSEDEQHHILYSIRNIIEIINGLNISKIGFSHHKYKRINREFSLSNIDKKVSELKTFPLNNNMDDKMLQSFIDQFINVTSKVSKAENLTINLSNDEYYKIAYQFAHEYDNGYFELLKSMYENNRLNIINFKKCKFNFVSFFQWIPYLKKSYIFINDFGSLNTIKGILHEVEHAFECELTAYRFPHKNDSYFSEVTPLFIELVFVDYLKNKGLFKKEIEELEKFNIFTMKNYAIEIKKSLLIKNFIDNYSKLHNYDEKQRTTLYFDNIKIQNALAVIGIRNISISDIETGKKCFVPINLRYITNQLIAYKLFDIYSKDKEEALRAIRYLIINNDKDPIDNYNDLGIDINYDYLLSLYNKYVDKVMNKEDVEDEQLHSSTMNY